MPVKKQGNFFSQPRLNIYRKWLIFHVGKKSKQERKMENQSQIKNKFPPQNISSVLLSWITCDKEFSPLDFFPFIFLMIAIRAKCVKIKSMREKIWKFSLIHTFIFIEKTDDDDDDTATTSQSWCLILNIFFHSLSSSHLKRKNVIDFLMNIFLFIWLFLFCYCVWQITQ